MSKRPISVCSRASSSGGGLADAPKLLGVVLGVAVRRRVVRRVRDRPERRVALRLGGGELLLGLLERGLDRPQRLELLGRRLALELRLPAKLVDLRDERAPALVRGEERVELVGGALARERGAPALRVRACGLQVDHGESLGALGACDRRHVRRDVGDLLLAERSENDGMPPWPFVTRSRASS